MRSRRRPVRLGPPGLTGAARVGVDSGSRWERGDVAVVDRSDLDLGTAHGMVDAGVVAVVNAGRLAGGRYANLGPELLAENDVAWVDGAGTQALRRIRDGVQVRICEGDVLDLDDRLLAQGRVVDLHRVRAGAPPVGALAALPELRVSVTGRPALVVAVAAHADLRRVAPFVRAQGPVIVAVGRAAMDDLVGLAWLPDLVVLPPEEDGHSTVDGRSPDLGPDLGLGSDTDVVTADHPDDAAVLLMGRDGATVVVTVGVVVGDAVRAGLGARLVDAAALWLLEGDASRRRRWWGGAVAAGTVAAALVGLTLALPDWVARLGHLITSLV